MKQRDQDQPILTFYGVDGKPMGDYTINWDTTHVWFASASQASVGFFGLENPNRLQSKGNHYPYGEQKGAYPPSFATYTRDTFTNLDYAVNRYYSATSGRFISPDPYQASGGPTDPGSWNRYSYVQGDPVNYHDPAGLMQEVPTFRITVTALSGSMGGMSEIDWALARMYWRPNDMPGGTGGASQESYDHPQVSRADAIDKGLSTAFDCLVTATRDHFGDTVAHGALTVLGAPMHKGWLPPFRVIGPNPATSILSSVGNFIRIAVPRVANTANLLRAVGRISGPVGALLLAYDIATIAMDTWDCYSKRLAEQP
ncbi:MAG: RHS repeat-associated core domain-containing protein [Bryobacterales bacterium]|nr:RHS repeat-associated core domain-containing protein [Bryobacterales bacterium]